MAGTYNDIVRSTEPWKWNTPTQGCAITLERIRFWVRYMHSEEYIEGAKTTEPTFEHYVHSYERLNELENMRLLHAAMGISTEAGEFEDTIKKFIFYGKPVDEVNLAEEIGDLFWYIAIACDVLGQNFEGIMEKNLKKLKARYPDRFSEQSANVRDLTNERKILERE